MERERLDLRTEDPPPDYWRAVNLPSSPRAPLARAKPYPAVADAAELPPPPYSIHLRREGAEERERRFVRDGHELCMAVLTLCFSYALGLLLTYLAAVAFATSRDKSVWTCA